MTNALAYSTVALMTKKKLCNIDTWSEPTFGGGGFGCSASSSEADNEHIDFESDLGDGDDRRFDVLLPNSSLMRPPMRGSRPAAMRAAALTGGKLLFRNGNGPVCPAARLPAAAAGLFMKNGRWAARAAAAVGTPARSV